MGDTSPEVTVERILAMRRDLERFVVYPVNGFYTMQAHPSAVRTIVWFEMSAFKYRRKAAREAKLREFAARGLWRP